MEPDHLLVIGFGAPSHQNEVRPFLERYRKQSPFPLSHLQELEARYRAIGGFSPYNESVFQFVERLKDRFRKSPVPLDIFCGMKNWVPFLKDTLRVIRERGYRSGCAMILAPHRSPASFDRYLESLNEAIRETGDSPLAYKVLGPWHEDPGFIRAAIDEARKAQKTLPFEERDISILFTAHSIPLSMPNHSSYREEVFSSCVRVAEGLKVREWYVAFQSPGFSDFSSWLGPSPEAELMRIAKANRRALLVIPIGFLCENAEVLYDLDCALRQKAEALGLRYVRSRTVLHHDGVVEMFFQKVQGVLSRRGLKQALS